MLDRSYIWSYYDDNR